jgi:nucleoside-diphosphate-sugar epimerase
MKYLITGGTGFIGSALVHRLAREGAQIRVLDNETRGSSHRLKDIFSKIELIKADIRDAAAVQQACQGIDRVCHLAYINGTEFFYSQPELVLDVAVKGMMNVIDGCIANKVPELILASSSEVYQTPPTTPTDEAAPLSIPDPLNPRYSYGGGKIISELMAINFGRKHFKRVIIFRPHNVYGPDMGYEHVIPQMSLRLKQLASTTKGDIDFPIEGTGKETRAFVYIDDFIDGLMAVINKGKHLEIYHIGTMEEVSIESVALEIGAYFKRSIRIVPGAIKPGGTLRRCPDISKIKQMGYNPRVSFKEGIGLTTKWYNEHGKK